MAEWAWLKGSASYQCGPVEMHRNTTASAELGNRLLSKTPHLSKILAVPTACSSPAVFAKHPGRGLLSWDRLFHLPDRNQKWNVVGIPENRVCRKRHSKNYDIQRNGQQLLQCRHASAWTGTILRPGHTKANFQVMSSAQEYQKEEKKYTGNWHYYAEHSKCCIKRTTTTTNRTKQPGCYILFIVRALAISKSIIMWGMFSCYHFFFFNRDNCDF